MQFRVLAKLRFAARRRASHIQMKYSSGWPDCLPSRCLQRCPTHVGNLTLPPLHILFPSVFLLFSSMARNRCCGTGKLQDDEGGLRGEDLEFALSNKITTL